MTTTARRKPTSTPMPAGQLVQRAEQAKKIIAAARRKATRIASDEAANRSTRARGVLKVKADALDEIEKLLAGKD